MNLIITGLIAGALGCAIGTRVGWWLVENERAKWGITHGL